MIPWTYPHTIDNGGGERLVFVARVVGPNGDRLVVENVVAPDIGPPMHVHFFQTEALTVQQGRIGYCRPGEPPQFAGPGEEVVFPAGDAHRFWNAGAEPLRCTGYIEPPDNIEYFLSELFGSTQRNGGKRPGIFDASWLAWHFREEFRLLDIPGPVQRVLFPLTVALGRLLGKYERFRGAPAPRTK